MNFSARDRIAAAAAVQGGRSKTLTEFDFTSPSGLGAKSSKARGWQFDGLF
jgi:hypothetical protein